MDTKKFRQKVLDLAIRGKLVPQDPNDEPASVLLERIQAEKQKLIAEGKIKKEKRTSFIFKGEDNSYYEKVLENGKETITDITDEIPFDIPPNWTWCRLESVCSHISDGTHNPPKNKGKGIPLISAKNVIDNEISLSEITRWITELEWESESARAPISVGDILLTIVGTIGRSAIVNTTSKFAIQRSIALLKTITVFNSFIKYSLDSSVVQNQLLNNAKGTAQLGIYLNKLKDIFIALPPLTEQINIVDAIECLANNISQIDDAYSELDEKISLAKSKLLDLAIRGKLLPQNKDDEPASKLLERIRKEKESASQSSKGKRKTADSYIFNGEDNLYYEKIIENGKETIEIIGNEILYDIPKSWCWIKIEDIADVSRGGSPRPINNYITDSENGINWIKIGDAEKGGKYIFATKEKIKKEGVKHSKYVESGDFLLSNSMSFGRPYILKTDGCIHDGWLSIKFDRSILNEDFLYLLLSSKFMYHQFESLAVGSTVKNLKSDSVKIAKIPIPPINEQKRISEFLGMAFKQLDSLIQH